MQIINQVTVITVSLKKTQTNQTNQKTPDNNNVINNEL